MRVEPRGSLWAHETPCRHEPRGLGDCGQHGDPGRARLDRQERAAVVILLEKRPPSARYDTA